MAMSIPSSLSMQKPHRASPFVSSSSAKEWLQSAIDQVRQSMRDAMHRVDCLLVETGCSTHVHTILHALSPASGTLPHSTAWVRFVAQPATQLATLAGNTRIHDTPALVSTIRGVEAAWPYICADLMASLLTVRVAIFVDVEHALQRDPAGFAKFVAWCAGNLNLVVIVVPDATAIQRLPLQQIRIAVDTILLPNRSNIAASSAATSALLIRIGKGSTS